MSVLERVSCLFDLEQQRFDVEVMARLASEEGARPAYEWLLAELEGGSFDHLLPDKHLGLKDLSSSLIARSAKNIVDFHFEPYVLQSMLNEQLRHYFLSVDKTLPLAELDWIRNHNPLWIDTVHHVCIFSIIYKLSEHLVTELGYRGLVLLHQGLRPEPRLDVFAQLFQQTLGIRPLYIPLREQWMSTLVKATTPDTMIFYLTDMPPEATARTASGPRRGTHLQLDCPNEGMIDVETLSGSEVFAKRLDAQHMVMDFPRRTSIRCRQFDKAVATTCCLEDWAFWPLLSRQDR